MACRRADDRRRGDFARITLRVLIENDGLEPVKCFGILLLEKSFIMREKQTVEIRLWRSGGHKVHRVS